MNAIAHAAQLVSTEFPDPTLLPQPCAELRLSALTHNLDRVKECAPSAKIMAVVKANAYGHGLVRVARQLTGADAFAVARMEEGKVLRTAGITQRIVVLQGFVRADELEFCAKWRLEPVIHALHQIELIERAPTGKRLRVWMKVDSGMHRLGLPAVELAECRSRLTAVPRIRQPIPMMTHFANADALDDRSTERQAAVFENAVASVNAERSLANSAGILGWSQFSSEWVRPGVMLYGVSPFPDRSGAELGLEPVMTLRTRLIAIKWLAVGDAVGYGGDWVCARPTRLGVAAIGYGDGYPRHAVSGTPVLIGGHRVPLVGRVSMDMITVDLTDHPTVTMNDSVVLWGDGLPVEEVAQSAGTIPYELLCGITQRVPLVERH